MPSRQVLRFDEFELDLTAPELRKCGAKVRIRQKPLDLLVYLAANCDRVVSKDELLDRVWHGVTVSADALTSALRDLRRALGDSVSPHRMIVTVRTHGYRLAAEAQREVERREPELGAALHPVEVFQILPGGGMQRFRDTEIAEPVDLVIVVRCRLGL